MSAILWARWLTLGAVAAITALSLVFAREVAIDTSLEAWFLEDSQTMLTYEEFRRQFGEDEFIVLSVEAEDVFTPPVLGELQRLTTAAEGIGHVGGVISLTNVEVLRRRGRSVRSGPLMEQLPKNDEQAEQLRKTALSYPLIAGRLFSSNSRAAAIVVELSRDCDTFKEKAEVARELASICRDHLPGVRLRAAGSPVLNDAIARYIEKDLRTLTPASFVIVLAAIYLLFRQFAVPMISLSVVALAALWVVGAMGMSGIPMSLLGPVLLSIVLVVGIADSVHIFAAYFQELDHSETRIEAIERGLAHVLVPCCFTSMTTVAGFLSLLSSSLEPVRQFGVFASLGVTFAFFLSIFLIPALLCLIPVRDRKARLQQQGCSREQRTLMDWILGILGRPEPRVSLLVLIVSTVLLVPSIWSISMIQITANPMNYFHSEDPVRADAEAIDSELGGAASLEFIVRAEGGGLKDLSVLRPLNHFEAWLQKQPSVTGIMSFATLLKEVDRVRRSRADGRGELPRSNLELRLAASMMEKAAPDLLRAHVRDDYSLGRISARVQAADADKLVAQAPAIERMVRTKVNAPGLELEPTGFVKLMDDMRSYVIRSQITSILLAFGAIMLMLLILFRSWKLTLFSMIPNVGPIVMGLAFMVVMKIRLDPGTVMIATIGLGLVVDDTCHFLVRLRRFTKAGQALPEAIAETMRQTGRPIILTSVILAAGFGVLTLGSFTTTFCFGIVSAFVLLTALAADLLVLPAALLILRPRL